MPYKSAAQRRFFRGCAHGMQPKGGRKCPPKEVLDEYEEAERRKHRRRKRMSKKRHGLEHT